MSDVLPNQVMVVDAGTVLTIGYEDCIRYHGRTSIGGVALGFRLLQRADGYGYTQIFTNQERRRSSPT